MTGTPMTSVASCHGLSFLRFGGHRTADVISAGGGRNAGASCGLPSGGVGVAMGDDPFDLYGRPRFSCASPRTNPGPVPCLLFAGRAPETGDETVAEPVEGSEEPPKGRSAERRRPEGDH